MLNAQCSMAGATRPLHRALSIEQFSFFMVVAVRAGLGHNPVGVGSPRRDAPRVARSSQPWALLRNPFGIRTVPTRCTQGSSFLAFLIICPQFRNAVSANPEGIVSSSPGLRACELPWEIVPTASQPQRGCGGARHARTQPRWGWLASTRYYPG